MLVPETAGGAVPPLLPPDFPAGGGEDGFERPEVVPPPQKSASAAAFWYTLPLPLPLPLPAAAAVCGGELPADRPEARVEAPVVPPLVVAPPSPQKSLFVAALGGCFAAWDVAAVAGDAPLRLAESSLQRFSTSCGVQRGAVPILVVMRRVETLDFQGIFRGLR